ncbi:MAG: HU family DNA-binding protein [Acidobacteria bacterium]|jgi:DNA-binding protein HU-beta|nr:HU family DNA-binding protein [Acidobacteriota bacterium]
MNKNELALQMTKSAGGTKNEALKVIDVLVKVIAEELKKKEGKLTLVGFGTFKTIVKKEKKGRNPRTGKEIIIPKKRVVKFLAGKKLKDLIK